jgi:putative phosphoribosyl transferase
VNSVGHQHGTDIDRDQFINSGTALAFVVKKHGAVMARTSVDRLPTGSIESREVRIPPLGLHGTLRIPANASSLVVFVHGSGSSRFSFRNVRVAEALNHAGFASLLFDLLMPEEEEANNRAKVFDIALLAGRLLDTIHWIDHEPGLRRMQLGLFGASTGAAAALVAAAQLGPRVAAVVSRGGRPDLAAPVLTRVRSPTLLIVGGEDYGVIDLNEQAFAALRSPKDLEIVPGATHLFPEPGSMERVIALAAHWFQRHLNTREI